MGNAVYLGYATSLCLVGIVSAQTSMIGKDGAGQSGWDGRAIGIVGAEDLRGSVHQHWSLKRGRTVAAMAHAHGGVICRLHGEGRGDGRESEGGTSRSAPRMKSRIKAMSDEDDGSLRR